ncbi:MAG: hypothetical protein RMK30_00305 [Anaerolineae bacterium]|nr:hypothetical protein [Anaerolineae bacterium]MDW8101310.1 hypothetical protein [Anaerolineae bacterium]
MDTRRRKILKGAAAGGALLTLGVIGGVGSFKAGQNLAKVEYELEIAKLRTLIKLYQELDKIGIDALLKTALKTITLPLETVKKGISVLKEAVEKAEEALSRLLSALARWQELLKEGKEIVLEIVSSMEEAGKLMARALGKILPFAEAVIEFFARLLQKLPFGAGKELGEALESVKTLLRNLPQIVERINLKIFGGLGEDINPGDSGKAKVEEEVSEPIKLGLLEPLKVFLEDVMVLVDSIERDFATPIETALAERAKIRQQIEEFRRQHGL